jgi:ATP-binding protein involved in chromosome partitioning
MATPSALSSPPTIDQVTQALDGVSDPEIHRPITDLGMVKNIDIGADGAVRVDVWLTVAGCPLRDTITRDVTAAVSKLVGVSKVRVELDVMSEEQRRALQSTLRGGAPERIIPFAQPGSLTKVYAVASGKGGVGK